MANVLVNENSLSDIADAIRAKNGSQSTYKPSQMADAISAISGGGITPTGTVQITQNGTVDVTQYASADVNVPTEGTTPTGTKQITISSNGTTTEDVTNYASAEITVNVPASGGNGASGEFVVSTGVKSGSIETNLASLQYFALVFIGANSASPSAWETVAFFIDRNESFKQCIIKSGSSWNRNATGTVTFSDGTITFSSLNYNLAVGTYRWYAL